MNLFPEPQTDIRRPLAARLRPAELSEFVGQPHLVGAESQIRQAIEAGSLGSVILWGPAGCGKTTLARIIASLADCFLDERSAVTCGVADIKTITHQARNRQRPTVLFLDEIHHFTRTQQDSLLGCVEDGVFTLIGATTENPTFSLATPLISRCRVLVLKPLSGDDLRKIIERAANSLDISFEPEAVEVLVRWANGDARTLLNCIEFSAQIAFPSTTIIAEHIATAMSRPLTRYDQKGDQHYDVISAFIKSVRGSDVDASLHYLARMIKAGEDPRFIARRLVILASEDIGNAAPMGLLVANAAFQAVERIGMPEARLTLAQATIFLAGSPKSNSAYLAMDGALDDLDKTAAPRVPDHLRDANSKRHDITQDPVEYKYPHEFGGWVRQAYLPDGHGLSLPYYKPIEAGYEEKIAAFLNSLNETK